MPRRVLLFDFDGTLADSLPAAVAVFNSMAPRFRLNPVDLAVARRTPTRELLRQMGVGWWKLPRITRAFRDGMAGQAADLRLFPGLPETLRELHAGGRLLGVVSSNRADTIEACLRANGVSDCFRFVVGSSSLFGKARVLKRTLRAHGLIPADVVYVGDELRDIAAARAAGLASAAVTWGMQTAELLRTGEPDVVLEEPGDLLRI